LTIEKPPEKSKNNTYKAVKSATLLLDFISIFLTFTFEFGIKLDVRADPCNARIEGGSLKEPIPVTQGNQALTDRKRLLR